MNKPKVAVIGSLNMDIVVETRRHPQVGETLLGEQIRFIPGGKERTRRLRRRGLARRRR